MSYSDDDSDIVISHAQVSKKRKYSERRDYDKKQDDGVVVSKYTPSHSKGKNVLSHNTDNARRQQQNQMDYAYNRLVTAKVMNYRHGLSKELVEQYPELEPYVCWSAKHNVKGINFKRHGGSHSEKRYLEVGGGNGGVKRSKGKRFHSHKLSLCKKLNILYSQLEPRNEEASHLCHDNKGCWRPEHLYNESHADNCQRNSGIGCNGSIFIEETGELIHACKHETPCVFVRII
jgi:hypothetical protein